MLWGAIFLMVILAILAYATGRLSRYSGIFAVLAGFVPLAMLIDWAPSVGLKHLASMGFERSAALNMNIATLHLSITPLSWLFLTLVGGIFPFIALYAISYFRRAPGGFFGSMTLALVGATGVVLASDLLTFFIFWEVMSWSAFLLVIRGKDRSAITSYFSFSALSAYLVLFGIMVLRSEAGTLSFNTLSTSITSSRLTLLAFISMAAGFGVKGALMPLHIWAPKAYSRSEEPFVAYLSGGLSKLGYYGIFLLFYSFIGIDVITKFGTFRGVPYLGYSLAIFGALSAFIGTVLAFMEDDLRKLLAYSSISQLGYIAIGIGIGTPLALSGALFQAVNHTFFKAVLFLAAGSVYYRTGKWKISELGGVAYRMPYTFLAALFSIFALAAIPITSGFAAKWLLYVSTVDRRFVFLTPIMLIAGVGAFLYSFRILYGVFLGEPRYPDIKEAPALQLIPMWILVMPLVIFLVLPGRLMDVFGEIFAYYKLEGVSHTDFTITTPLSSYNTLAVIFALMGGLMVAFMIYLSKPHRVVSHYDNYLSGEIPEVHEGLSLHAASRFYKPVEDLFRPYTDHGAERFYHNLEFGLEGLGDGLRRLFKTTVSNMLYLVLAGLLLIGWWLTW